MRKHHTHTHTHTRALNWHNSQVVPMSQRTFNMYEQHQRGISWHVAPPNDQAYYHIYANVFHFCCSLFVEPQWKMQMIQLETAMMISSDHLNACFVAFPLTNSFSEKIILLLVLLFVTCHKEFLKRIWK